jgi:hypothetical protein
LALSILEVTMFGRWRMTAMTWRLPPAAPFLGCGRRAALAGPLDLGGGPLQAGADLVGLDLGDRP